MKQSQANKKKYLIWLTGIAGSGKTTIARKIISRVRKRLGPTILINGDDMREIFSLKSYGIKGRKKVAIAYTKLCKLIIDQGVNIIFATVSMYDDVRKLNRKNFRKNYIEIFIDADIKNILKNKKKFLYFTNKKSIVGKGVKAEYPKNPDIIIKNDFSKNLNTISKEILQKIFKK